MNFHRQSTDAPKARGDHVFFHPHLRAADINPMPLRDDPHRRDDARAKRRRHKIRGRKGFSFTHVVFWGVRCENRRRRTVRGGTMKLTFVDNVYFNHARNYRLHDTQGQIGNCVR